jgi:DNA-binding transcriptional MerR regulator
VSVDRALPEGPFEKHFYRVGEVAKLVGVEPHVIRYWEREARIVRTKKNGAGQRVFSRRDVERLLALKQLVYGEGYTLTGAVRQLALGRKVDESASDAQPTQLEFESAIVAASEPRVSGEQLRRSLESTRANLVEFLAWLGANVDEPEAPAEFVPARRQERQARPAQASPR